MSTANNNKKNNDKSKLVYHSGKPKNTSETSTKGPYTVTTVKDFDNLFPTQETSTTQNPAPTSAAPKAPQTQQDAGPKYTLTQDVRWMSLGCADGSQRMARVSRIRANKDICDKHGNIIIPEGTLGGYVESEANLSHKGLSWIYPDTIACGKVFVCDDALIGNHDANDIDEDEPNIMLIGPRFHTSNAAGKGKITISGTTRISGERIHIEAKNAGTIVLENSQIGDDCMVYTDSKFGINITNDSAVVRSEVYDNATICHAFVGPAVTLSGTADVRDCAIQDSSFSAGIISVDTDIRGY